MKDRWESDFPTTGNGLYSLVAVGPSGHPTRVKQPPGTSPVQGCDDVEPVSGSGFGKRNQSRGETSFSIRAGAKREVRRAKGCRRTDGRTVFVPSCLTTPRSYGLVGTAISGAAAAGGRSSVPLSRHEKTRCADKITCAVDEGSASTIVVSGRIEIQFEYFKGTRAKKSWQDKESCEVEKGLVRCVKGSWGTFHETLVMINLSLTVFVITFFILFYF